MNSFLDKLNLRPQERRLVVGILVVVFVVLNIWLVWPQFSAWGRVKGDLHKAQDTLYRYNQKIAKVRGPNGFETKLKTLEGTGAAVVADEQEIQLLRSVQNQVAQINQASPGKFNVSGYGTVLPSNTSETNEFFAEQSMKITVSTGEKELVDFLLNIGAGSSMIRVRDLDLRPADQNRYKLQGTITLSANYQRATPAKSRVAALGTASPAPAKSATATKPATPTTPAPAGKPTTPPIQSLKPKKT